LTKILFFSFLVRDLFPIVESVVGVVVEGIVVGVVGEGIVLVAGLKHWATAANPGYLKFVLERNLN